MTTLQALGWTALVALGLGCWIAICITAHRLLDYDHIFWGAFVMFSPILVVVFLAFRLTP